MTLRLSLLALSFMSATTLANPSGIIPIEDVTQGRLSAPPALPAVDQIQTPPQGVRIDANAIRQGIQTMTQPGYKEVVEDYENKFNAPTETAAPSKSIIDAITKAWKPTQELKLSPGENIVIPVGQGLMSSVKTNFKMLAARTSDKDSILEIEGGFLYVTINGNQPVGLILYEDGVMESQISVTLVPIQAPPSMVDIEVTMSQAMLFKGEEYRKQIELEEKIATQTDNASINSTAYTDRIIGLLTPVAKGDLPPGFSMTNDIPTYLSTPCQVTVYQTAAQRLTGGREIIDVVLIRNDSDRGYRVREEMCLSAGVKAVALFEKSYLRPGDETEVYILRDKLYEQEMQRKNRRPRLTGAGL